MRDAGEPWLYRPTKWFFQALFALVLDLRVSGLEHVPAAGPAILVANHPCALDGFLTLAAMPRVMYGWTAHTNFLNPMSGWFLRGIGHMPVEAGGDNRPTMEQTKALMRRGEVLMLCPEGDVNPSLPLRPFKGGFLKMATTMDIPVLPMAIVGSDKVLSEPVHPRKLSHHIPHSCRVDLALLPPMRFENRVEDTQYFNQSLEACRRLIAAKVEEIQLQRVGKG